MKRFMQLLVVIFLALHNYGLQADNQELCCPTSSYEVYGSVLILQPSSSNLNYTAEAISLPIVSPHWNTFEIKPRYHAGFDLGFLYTMPSRGLTFNIDWEHLNSSDSAHHQVAVDTDLVGPFFEIGPAATLYKVAEGKNTFHFNRLHLNVGTMTSITSLLHAYLFTGVSFASIKQTLFAQFTSIDESVLLNIKTPLSFIGAGPECGIQATYQCNNRIKLTANFTAALLVGKLGNQTTYTTNSSDLPSFDVTPPNIQTANPQHSTQIIPVLKESLGLSYNFFLCKNYHVTVEVGYQAQLYFNALQSVNVNTQVAVPAPTVGILARSFQKALSNFGLAGPYVAFKVAF